MDRQKVMNNPSVRNLTKDVLKLSENKDVVDRYYDVKLALDTLKQDMHWIYKQLETEYDWLMSDENIIDTINANDYEFYEDGEMI